MHLSPAYLPWARAQDSAGEWAVDAGRGHAQHLWPLAPSWAA